LTDPVRLAAVLFVALQLVYPVVEERTDQYGT